MSAAEVLREHPIIQRDNGVWYCPTCSLNLPGGPNGLARAQHQEEMLREAGLLAEPLVEQLQALCDDEWLRRRDRIMRLPGSRYMRDRGAAEIEQAAGVVRDLIEDLPGYDPIGTGGAYLRWTRDGRDGVEVP